ncbi:DoxX family protein [Nocardia arizonensis]|uniref:DoxX family protein n=1 Tax=Nocardia arizonensis TaxID=1141647 RepID=UPI0006D0864B|nr:DoxX family protein [Nocardia arizonensis]
MTAITAAAVRPGKALNRTLWTLQILFGVFFIAGSGLPKLIGESNAVRTFAEIGAGSWFMYFTGAVEIAGGLGLLIYRTSGLAAAGLSILTVCAAATQAFILDAPLMAIFPLVLAAIFAAIAYLRRDSIDALRATVAR